MKSVIEHEAQRVAVAFGAHAWALLEHEPEDEFLHWEAVLEEAVLAWCICIPNLTLDHLSLRSFDGENSCDFWCKQELSCIACQYPPFHELMARGLYCLGIEDEDVLQELNCHLSWTEKMELRQEMPREFWPLAWYDQGDRTTF